MHENWESCRLWHVRLCAHGCNDGLSSVAVLVVIATATAALSSSLEEFIFLFACVSGPAIDLWFVLQGLCVTVDVLA